VTTQTILGVRFFEGTEDEMMGRARGGGLIVAPSGPGLTMDLARDPAYRTAVTTADLALPDSGFMVLLWNLLGAGGKRNRLRRVSGLRFLRRLLQEPELRAPGATFWVMPSAGERDRNLNWLRLQGFAPLSADDCYLAPDYREPRHRTADGSLADENLARAIEARHPRWIFLNIGSGVQEPLGHWLRGRLSTKPAIICSGAAIAFLSGGQADIPPWADRFYLGWLLRVWRKPGTFLPRYVRALGLLPVLLRWRDELPPLHPRDRSNGGVP
jgi:UDP-N-acetyl-D-mannosaminuronic acid transferase (WecB/TagA/CpsF family)